MQTQALIDHFQQYFPFKEEEKKLIKSKVTLHKIKRRQMILQEGFVCKHYSFVLKGCFKMYGIDDKGCAHTIQFAAEGDWIADIGSFHSKKHSKLFIEAIEPSEIIQIEQQDLYFLYTNMPKLDRIFRVIVENKFIELQNRVLLNISSTAGETAEMFINDMKYSSFIVDKMLGNNKKGFVGLYVDIGTIGYFKDLKVTKRALKLKKDGEKIDDI